MLILKPKGRGNWATLVVSVEGSRASSLLIHVGQLVPLGGILYRICRVLP